MQTVESPKATVFTRVDVARILNVSPGWVDQLLRDGRATRSVTTAGGRRLFSRADVEALAATIGRSDRLSGMAA